MIQVFVIEDDADKPIQYTMKDSEISDTSERLEARFVNFGRISKLSHQLRDQMLELGVN